MFDKFEQRRKLNSRSAYAWWHWNHDHQRRYQRLIDAMPRKLICQDCKGEGQHWEDAIDYWNIYSPCGWCEGTGYVTPWLRGQWLRCQREAKRAA